MRRQLMWVLATLILQESILQTIGQEHNNTITEISEPDSIPEYEANISNIELLNDEDLENTTYTPLNTSETYTEDPLGAGSSSSADFGIDSRSVEITDYIVETDDGPVKGNIYENSDIIAYIDIPYAEVDKPFDAPKEGKAWSELHDKISHDSVCPQIKNDEYVGDLNCLTLSIFTPVDVQNASVLFHIHDPYFGSGDPLIYGPQHLVPKGIILVLPNYRIGALGFLCLHNETAPGNAGLKDLNLALKWVSKNIESFGGNPNNMVVSGDGAGGALAGYLALYAHSKYNIKRAITESGSVLSPWALDRDPLNTAVALAENIREEYQGEAINNVFGEVGITEILKAAKYVSFNPCLEKPIENHESFMEVSPWRHLHHRTIDITFMSGSASHAGTSEALSLTDTAIDDLNEDFGVIFPNDLHFETNADRQKVGLRIKEQYFGESNISQSNLEELSLYYTDASYLGPVVRFARPIVKRRGRVFLYEFGFVGSLNFMLEALENPVEGAVRSDVIGYLFKQHDSQIVEGSPERQMINKLVDLWISFINEGEPSSEGIDWIELTDTDETNEEWLLINTELKMAQGVHTDRLKLWTSLYNEYYIERSAGVIPRPNYLIPFTAGFILWIWYTKLNYKY